MPKVADEVEETTAAGLLPAKPVEVLLDRRSLILLGALALGTAGSAAQVLVIALCHSSSGALDLMRRSTFDETSARVTLSSDKSMGAAGLCPLRRITK
jgi:hypothetical protein